MRWPSGDQTGFDDLPFVGEAGAEPAREVEQPEVGAAGARVFERRGEALPVGREPDAIEDARLADGAGGVSGGVKADQPGWIGVGSGIGAGGAGLVDERTPGGGVRSREMAEVRAGGVRDLLGDGGGFAGGLYVVGIEWLRHQGV